MRPLFLSLMLGTVLALAAGGGYAQQMSCPATPQGTAPSAACAVVGKNALSAATPSPYVSPGYSLSSNWSLGANAGVSRGIASPGPAGSFARNGADSSYAGADLLGSYWFGHSHFATRFSLVQGEDRLGLGGFGLSSAPYSNDYRSYWSQAAATARYGYAFDSFMPYASVTLASNLNRPANPSLSGMGSSAWTPRVGVDFFARKGLSGGVSYSSEQGNTYKNDVWSANLNFKF